MPQDTMTRRDFLDYLLFTSLTATALSALAPVPFYLVPPEDPSQKPARLKLADLPDGGAQKVLHRGRPVLVMREGENVRAISAVCTHLQCTVDWDSREKKIKCPCHGGVFDARGAVLIGPPQSSLPAVSVKIVGDEIVVEG